MFVLGALYLFCIGGDRRHHTRWGVAKRLRQRVLIPIREGSTPFVPTKQSLLLVARVTNRRVRA
jgi:hypothetical protein